MFATIGPNWKSHYLIDGLNRKMTICEDTAPIADSRLLTRAAIRPQMEPTPAAAPSLMPADKTKRPFEGILKAVVDESNTSHYVTLPQNVCRISSDMSEALR
ncbi:hypothetical protein FS837_005340, partial [Tulasnella sp. UAMH 9824]